MLIMIGSRALNLRTDYGRDMIDYDFIGTYDDFIELYHAIGKNEIVKASYPMNNGETWVIKTDKNIYECELVWSNSNVEVLSSLILNDTDTINDIDIYGQFIAIPSVDVLYMLKMSHRYKKNSPHFLKTMKDIRHMRSVGATIPEYYRAAYDARVKDTYSYGHPKLNVGKKDFFTDSVDYKFEHDDIHTAIMHLDKPAYEYYKEDKAEVNCSRDLFFNIDESTRLLGVLEESYVLALERSQIPTDFKCEPKLSFDMALSKVCTSITSGWFREFAWENYDKVQSMYSDDYVDRFKSALEAGKVKPYIKEQTMGMMS